MARFTTLKSDLVRAHDGTVRRADASYHAVAAWPSGVVMASTQYETFIVRGQSRRSLPQPCSHIGGDLASTVWCVNAVPGELSIGFSRDGGDTWRVAKTAFSPAIGSVNIDPLGFVSVLDAANNQLWAVDVASDGIALRLERVGPPSPAEGSPLIFCSPERACIVSNTIDAGSGRSAALRWGLTCVNRPASQSSQWYFLPGGEIYATAVAASSWWEIDASRRTLRTNATLWPQWRVVPLSGRAHRISASKDAAFVLLEANRAYFVSMASLDGGSIQSASWPSQVDTYYGDFNASGGLLATAGADGVFVLHRDGHVERVLESAPSVSSASSP